MSASHNLIFELGVETKMKMKWIMHIVILAVLTATVTIAQSENKPAFTNLQEAVSFMVTCINQGATNRFDAAFVDPKNDSEMHKNVFIGLKRINENRPLATLYQGKDFPTNSPAFWLGGHGKELGFINIRFIHTNGVWQLSDSFYCR